MAIRSRLSATEVNSDNDPVVKKYLDFERIVATSDGSKAERL